MALYLGSNKVAGAGVNSENIYSTEEQVVGTWIDGKPLYRKVVIAKTPTTSNWTNIALGTSNIKTLVKKEITFENDGRFFDGSYYESSDYYSYYSIDTINNNLQMRVCSLFYNKELKVILEYTKTTD